MHAALTQHIIQTAANLVELEPDELLKSNRKYARSARVMLAHLLHEFGHQPLEIARAIHRSPKAAQACLNTALAEPWRSWFNEARARIRHDCALQDRATAQRIITLLDRLALELNRLTTSPIRDASRQLASAARQLIRQLEAIHRVEPADSPRCTVRGCPFPAVTAEGWCTNHAIEHMQPELFRRKEQCAWH